MAAARRLTDASDIGSVADSDFGVSERQFAIGRQRTCEDPAERLAHAYWVLMSDGVLSDEDIVHLRNLWEAEDVDMSESLCQQVTANINRRYGALRDEFLEALEFEPLLRLSAWLPLQAPAHSAVKHGMRTLAHLVGTWILWEFKIEENDVRHALCGLKPPDEHAVKVPFVGVPVADILDQVLPIYEGADVRAGFQLLALTVWCRSDKNLRERLVALRSHVEKALTLYLSMFLAWLASFVMQWKTVWATIYLIYDLWTIPYVLPWTSPSSWVEWVQKNLWQVLWFPGYLWLTKICASVTGNIRTRVPMLTVRLHLSLLEKGYLDARHYQHFPAPDRDKKVQ